MTADLHIDFDAHLRSGRVWRVELELPMISIEGEDSLPDDVPSHIFVTVDVVAPNRDLAQYVAATLYPSYSSLCIDDEPLSPNDSEVQTSST
jgi:hypothetical protein